MHLDHDNDDLFSYPNAPGSKGGETSEAGAAAIAEAAGRLQRLVLTAVTEAGATGVTVVEMATRYGLDRMSIQPRFSELRRMGKIADSGRRRKNPSGVSVIVWTLREFVQAPPERAAA